MARFNPHMMIVSLGLSLMLGGCMIAQPLSGAEKEIQNDLDVSNYFPATREMRANIETQPLFAQAAFWGREYDLNPSDLESAIKLSAAVRKLGNPQRAIEIAQTTRALYPRDPYLTAEYAAALIASERALDAIKPLDSALSTAPNYARLWSLKGAALDQTEQYDLARRHYNRALQITPNDPNILANLGLSYALAGNPVAAESWLRRAAALPGAGAAVHQNLGLVLQLQGKTGEAQKIARLSRGDQKLPPPPVAAHNPSSNVNANRQNRRSQSVNQRAYLPSNSQNTRRQNVQPQQSLRRLPQPAFAPQTNGFNSPRRINNTNPNSTIQAAQQAAAQRQAGTKTTAVKPLPTAGELTSNQQALLNQISGNLNPRNQGKTPSPQIPRNIAAQQSQFQQRQPHIQTRPAPNGYPTQSYAPQAANGAPYLPRGAARRRR